MHFPQKFQTVEVVYRMTLRVLAFQLGEKAALGRPYSGLPEPEGSLRKSWGRTFHKGFL